MSFGRWFTRLPAAAGGYPSNKTLIWTALSGSMCENCGAAKPLADNYEGPFRVLERGTKSFKLQLGERVCAVSRDRLKPHLAREDPEPAVVRPRGRPRGGRLSDTSSLVN